MVWKCSEILASRYDARYIIYTNDDTDMLPVDIAVTEGNCQNVPLGSKNRFMLLVH